MNELDDFVVDVSALNSGEIVRVDVAQFDRYRIHTRWRWDLSLSSQGLYTRTQPTWENVDEIRLCHDLALKLTNIHDLFVELPATLGRVFFTSLDGYAVLKAWAKTCGRPLSFIPEQAYDAPSYLRGGRWQITGFTIDYFVNNLIAARYVEEREDESESEAI